VISGHLWEEENKQGCHTILLSCLHPFQSVDGTMSLGRICECMSFLVTKCSCMPMNLAMNLAHINGGTVVSVEARGYIYLIKWLWRHDDDRVFPFFRKMCAAVHDFSLLRDYNDATDDA
jgi:hypothetical protein